MGNSNGGKFESRNWTFDRRNFNYDIYRDNKGTYAEKHIVPNNPKIDPEDEIEIYNYRYLTDKPIVRVYEAEYVKSDNVCGADRNIEVYSEHIPYRLSDTRNLNNGQALYVLSEALAGFHELHHRFGPFQITDDNIGFNDDGEVRVWHSPNFASNHLPLDRLILMSTRNPKNFDERMEKRQEEEMVEDIWMAVDDHALIDGGFRNRSDNFREMNFAEARRIVADQISHSSSYVPEYLNFRLSHSQAGSARRQGQERVSGDYYEHQAGSRYTTQHQNQQQTFSAVNNYESNNNQYKHDSVY